MSDILTITLNPTVDVSSDTDLVRPTHKIRTHNQNHFPGGGGINVARAIIELGGVATVLYLTGGASGALLDDCLRRSGITAEAVTIDQPIRIAYTVHELKTGFEYRFVPEGPEVDPAVLDGILQRVERFDGHYIVASGSLPVGLPDDTYVRIAEIAERRGIRFVLDASGPALEAAFRKANCFLIKPSLGELGKLVGSHLDEEEVGLVAMDFVRKGRISNLAVSFGAHGALLASRDGILRLPARHVRVRSAVGAGDSFVGGMVHQLAQGASVEAAFRTGIAAGAAAVMTSGTQLCRREDVEALMRDAGNTRSLTRLEETGAH